MEATFLEFNRWLNKDSRILIMMGATNCSRRRLHQLIPMADDDEVCQIELDVPFELFSEPPRFFIASSVTT
jgi:hypothetical protein